MRIATSGKVHWVAEVSEFDRSDAHQLVSQGCRQRIGNLVNPAFSVCCLMPKHLLGDHAPFMGGMHRRLANLA